MRGCACGYTHLFLSIFPDQQTSEIGNRWIMGLTLWLRCRWWCFHRGSGWAGSAPASFSSACRTRREPSCGGGERPAAGEWSPRGNGALVPAGLGQVGGHRRWAGGSDVLVMDVKDPVGFRTACLWLRQRPLCWWWPVLPSAAAANATNPQWKHSILNEIAKYT